MAKFIKLNEILNRYTYNKDNRLVEDTKVNEIIINADTINEVHSIIAKDDKSTKMLEIGAHCYLFTGVGYSHSDKIYFAETKEEIWDMLNK